MMVVVKFKLNLYNAAISTQNNTTLMNDCASFEYFAMVEMTVVDIFVRYQ